MDYDAAIAEIRSGTPRGLALYYELIFSDMGWTFPAHLMPVSMGICDTRINKLMLIIGPGSGKALHPDTPILTTRGWIPIEEARIGDMVYTPDGGTAPIRAVLPQPISQLYRVKFADGREVVANASHLWKVYTKKFAKRGEPLKWRTRTTEEVAAYLWHSRANRWYVPLSAPIPYPEATLPIPPYVMGCILGDGHCAPAGDVGLTSFDKELVTRVWTECRESECGYLTVRNPATGQWGLAGMGAKTKALGLAGKRSWEKSIPEAYMHGSVDQRFALLQGLLDTDGTVGALKSISYCTVSLQLAQDVQTLVRSLGGIAYRGTKLTSFTGADGEKKSGRLAYNISIRHPTPERLFHLSRKRAKAQPTQYSEDLKLEIISIELAERSESICINIGHPDGLFLCGDHVVTHNSQFLSITVPSWAIGRNPNATVLGISGGEALMQGFQKATMGIVEHSPHWKHVFPDVRPDKNAGWSTEGGMYVTGRRPGIPDASYLACGIDSKYLTGKHGQYIIIDDLHNAENSSTSEQCDKVVQKYANTILGRADPMGARFLMAGRRWNTDDIYGVLKGSDWVVMELPAEREGSKRLFFDIHVPDGMKCVFTDSHCQLASGELVRV